LIEFTKQINLIKKNKAALYHKKYWKQNKKSAFISKKKLSFRVLKKNKIKLDR
jgi:hypothetical protein